MSKPLKWVIECARCGTAFVVDHPAAAVPIHEDPDKPGQRCSGSDLIRKLIGPAD
jgi:hypothetical protein